MENILPINTVDDLTTLKDKFDLRNQFPRSKWAIIRNSFTWIAGYVFVVALIVIGHWQIKTVESPIIYNTYTDFSLLTVLMGAIILAAKLIYEILYHVYYYFGVEEGHLVISAGILLKERATFPLNSITDLHIDRGVLDLIFGLYNLYTANPSTASYAFGNIDGLGKREAVGLQDYVTRLINSVYPKNREAVHINPPYLQPIPVEGVWKPLNKPIGKKATALH